MNAARSRQQGALASSALTVCAWAFLWIYIRKSLYALWFEQGGVALGNIVYLVFCTLTLGLAVFVARHGNLAEKMLGRSAVAPAIGVAGTLGALGLQSLPLAGDLNWAGWITMVGCLALQACAFCGLFGGWVVRLHWQSFETSLRDQLICLLCAFAIGFLITLSSEASSFAHMAGFAVAGVCLRLMPAQGEHPVETPVDSEDARQIRPWLWLLGISLLVIGLLSYATLFTAPVDFNGSIDLVKNIIVFGTLAALTLCVLLMGEGRFDSRGFALPMVLGLMVAALCVFFVVMLSFIAESGVIYGIPRIIRPISRIVAFLTVLAITYQYGLNPLEPFTLWFLVPSIVPKPVLLVLTDLAPGAAGFLDNRMVLVALLATGFFMTICLVIFCLVNLDGRLTRVMLRSEGDDPDDSADQLRREACAAIGERFGLTRREVDVLGEFSAGASAQQTADTLAISVNTVNTHAMALYRKLGVHTKQEVMAFVDEWAGSSETRGSTE